MNARSLLSNERERADRHDQDSAEAARDSAARMDQERDRREIGGELQIRLRFRTEQTPAQQHELGAADAEHREQGHPSERRIRLADDSGRVDEIEHAEQHGR